MALPSEVQSGVIHDIGYRNYTGPRLGRSYATRSLYTQSLRAAYGLGRSGKSKVLPMLVLAAMGLPAVVVVAVVVITDLKSLPMDFTQYLTSFGLFPEIFLAAQAPVLLSRDLRHHIVPLYFSRPITRGDYVRAKFAAMASALMLLMTLPMAVLYLGSLLAGLPFGTSTVHLLYGLAAAALYALLYAALGLLIAAATPRRGFGVAAIMGMLVISSVIATFVLGLNGGLRHDPVESANWAATLSPATLVDGLVNQVFGLVTAPQVLHAPGPLAAFVFAAEIAVLVAGSYGLLLRRYRNV
ncbi:MULTISPECIES: ABC transporter permease [Kitasatospora]|uniref:ABC-2 type transport system permease protein n=2 Tax=Kitasatospora TaxID=2063 RepID=A0ABT1J846_9ACTN|nr:ABC transporter permease [Kitasatospora paracochleata]MCP2313288.1 ABC-2 type transport system permease protein [Kitasatospora paracochleata]